MNLVLNQNKSSWDAMADTWFGSTALPVYGCLAPTEDELHLFPDLSGKKVLDIGCGSGHSLRWCGQKGAAELWGLDLSEKQISNAQSYLTEKGYEILEYNYRCKLGEIDIIARDGDYLVFCEVKYRADDRKGTPAEAVDYAKQRVISKSALYYMTVNGIDEIPCRFDVVSIEDDRIILYQNAFDYVEI